MEEDGHARGSASKSSTQIKEKFGGPEAGQEGRTRCSNAIMVKGNFHVDDEQWAAPQKLSHEAGSRLPLEKKNHAPSSSVLTKGEASSTMLPTSGVRAANSLLSPIQIPESLNECKKPPCASKFEVPSVEKIPKIERPSETSSYLMEQLRGRRLQLLQGRREDIVFHVSDIGTVEPSFIVPNKKNEVSTSIESGGIQRHELKTTGLSVRREPITPSTKKWENPPATSPPESMKLCPNKNQRNGVCPPLKGLSGRNTKNLVGSAFKEGSEEDCEKLLDAAKYASCASVFACSGPFWKIIEPLFASDGLNDTTDTVKKDNLVHRLEALSCAVNSEEVQVNQLNELESSELDNTVDSVDQSQDITTSCGGLESEIASKNVFPLAQRILSATIEVEDTDGVSYDDEKRAMTSHSPVADDHFSESVKQYDEDAIDPEPGDAEYQSMSFNERCLLELQSIGIFHEMDSAEGREESEIDNEINELRMKLQQKVLQIHKAKENVLRAINVEKRTDVEQIAMDRLVELAYKKSKACSNKNTRKQLRQDAVNFAELTIRRCREYEKTGKSCFRESSLYGVITSAPQSSTLACFAGKSGARGPAKMQVGVRNRKRGPGKRVFPNRTKQQDRAPSAQDSAVSHPKPERLRKRKACDAAANASLRAILVIDDAPSNSAVGTGTGRDKDQQKDMTMASITDTNIPLPPGDPKDRPHAKTQATQNTAQEPTLGNGVLDKVTDAAVSVSSSLEMSTDTVIDKGKKVSEPDLPSCSNLTQGFSEENDDLLGLEDLNLLDFDISGWDLPDVDDCVSDECDLMGLSVPMDNLADLDIHFFH